MTTTPQPEDREHPQVRYITVAVVNGRLVASDRARLHTTRAEARAELDGLGDGYDWRVLEVREPDMSTPDVEQLRGDLDQASAFPSSVPTPDMQKAISAEVIVCAGVIVGVGGESDPCVTQVQADRATRLIVRELNKHGLLRPAVATNEQAVERLDRALELVDEFDGPEAPFEHHHKWVAVRDEITAARAALRAAQSGGGQ